MSIDNYDLETNFTAVAATINNIGPGLSLVGPTANYSHYGPFSTCVLIFDMIAGRLEIIPVLVLFSVHTWRDGEFLRRPVRSKKTQKKEEKAVLDELF